jgi:hypothetical protein
MRDRPHAPVVAPRFAGRRTTIRSLIAFALGCALLAAATTPARAQSAVQVNPNPAPAGAPLRATLVGLNAFCNPVESATVERQGFVVTLRVSFEFGLCGTPPPGDVVLPLGSFGAGDYTLVYQQVVQGGAPPPPLTTGFQVLPGPQTVPATDRYALLSLVALMLALGAVVFARRR